MHTPVLFKETIDGLEVKKGGLYIDATFGEGGHSNEIIRRGGNVLAIDWDEESVKRKLGSRIMNQELGMKLKLVTGNFADIENIAKENQFCPADGILFDFGLSMEQIGGSGRGFSFKNLNEPLDMRISGSNKTTAASLINSLNADELYEIFSRNSQEIDSRAISSAIFRANRMRPIKLVTDLVDVINSMTGLRSKKESVLRRLFQSLRMEVNDELTNIKIGLVGAFTVIKKGGRIAIITFHESEDRLIKQILRKSKVTLLTKKPIVAHSGLSYEESAKLRIVTI